MHRKKNKWRALAIVAVVIVAVLFPTAAIAWNVNLTPNYSWYGDGSATEFTLSNARDYRGFVELVNGTADIDGDETTPAVGDSFAGKTIKLSSNLNFMGQTVTPAGGAGTDRTFDGVFDGQGHTVDNFKIDTEALIADGVGTGSGYSIRDLGLIGAAGSSAVVKDTVIGSGGSITITLTSGNQAGVANVGLLVGSLDGSLLNCTNNGSIVIENPMNQTRDVMFPVMNVGGLSGIVLGDITGCSNAGSVSISAIGEPYVPQDGDGDWKDISVLVANVGGVVGNAGSVDSTAIYGEMALPEGYTVENVHGTISNCANSGTIYVNTPFKTGDGRVGPEYTSGSNIGGIAGYSRGSIYSCTNTGYLDVEKSNHVGGIVGGVRSTMVVDNFSTEGTDDGLMLHKEGNTEYLEVADCTNAGNIRGNAFVGGIAGVSGSYTKIESCLNEAGTYVLGTRASKPFAAGIVGSSYGEVAYCANLGTTASGDWADPSNPGTGEIQTRGGYYTAGIAGVLSFHQTRDEDGNVVRDDQPVPELYGCYNAGPVLAMDGFRQRGIVGDNSGYVHDNVLEEGKVYRDLMVYGLLEGEVGESTGGTIERNVVVTHEQLQGNEPLTAAQLLQYLGIDDAEADPVYPLALMNRNGVSQGLSWAKSDGTANGGYPVLASKVTWDVTSIATATVSLKADAPYTGLPSAPTATVALGDGTVLIQNVDFAVIADPNGIEISTGKPYTATIRGIGNYADDATNTLPYDVVKGSMADCSVVIDNLTFNWDPQMPAAEHVHVMNAGGVEVDASEYTYRLDPADKDLTDGQAVNAKTYTMIVEAVESSEHFVGSTTGEFRIKPVHLMTSRNTGSIGESAHPTTVSYDGAILAGDEDGDGVLPWESYYLDNADGIEMPTTVFQYTGHPIRPKVEEVVYLDRQLTEGVDYYVFYTSDLAGNGENGEQQSEDTANIGVKGELAKGYITVHPKAGGNFNNYDIMWFTIDGTSDEKLNLANATATFADGSDITPIPFEAGTVYTPIEIWYGGSRLEEGVDYEISYTQNDQLGTASFTATAVEDGLFAGSLSGTFELVDEPAYVFTWSFDDSAQTATVTGVVYNGVNDAFDMVIPDTIEHDGATYTVTAIGDKAFGGSTPPGGMDFVGSPEKESKLKIRSVVIPASVVTIGDNAFAGGSDSAKNNQLESVTFADAQKSALTTIGEGAFRSCGNLTEFTFPPNVTTIRARAFQSSRGNTQLHKLTFLTKDATLPSVVGTSFTFTGVGFDGQEVAVYGYASAARVQQLAEDNATSSGTGGKNKGMNFKFYELEEPAPDVHWGDADGDGNVNSLDALLVLQYSAGKVGEDQIHLANCDVDGDGNVNSLDALLILQFSAQKIDKFPVEE